MGVRKRERAEQLKEAKKNVAFAKLNNCPTSPRKMRLMADLIREKKWRRRFRYVNSVVRNLHVNWRNYCSLRLQIGKIRMKMQA